MRIQVIEHFLVSRTKAGVTEYDCNLPGGSRGWDQNINLARQLSEENASCIAKNFATTNKGDGYKYDHKQVV